MIPEVHRIENSYRSSLEKKLFSKKFLNFAGAIGRKNGIEASQTYFYDAEVYPKISALVKLTRKLDTYKVRNSETFFAPYFSQKGFRQFCEIKEHSERKVGYKSCSTFPLNLGIYYWHAMQ